MYYCNCLDSWKVKGINIPKSAYTEAGIHIFQQVEVNHNKCCVHCRYTAVWSKTNPNTKVAEKEFKADYEEEAYQFGSFK